MTTPPNSADCADIAATSPYADTYLLYRQLGWPGTLPVPVGKKWPPPEGFTGWDGIYPSGADAYAFTEESRWERANVVQRLPGTLVGLDVDAYGGKTGAATFTEAKRRWGPLPTGPWSSARDDGISGIRFFRVPDGTVLQTMIGFPELGIGHIEIIQRHHRYAVVWPSVHHTGATYTWRGAGGQTLTTPPGPQDFPPLPEPWLTALAGTGTGGERAAPEQVQALLAALPSGEACTSVANRLKDAATTLAAPVVSRHDDMCRHVLALLRLGEQGHPGVATALTALRELFVRAVTSDESRTRSAAQAEYDRMRDGEHGVGLILGTPTAPADRGCRCPAPWPELIPLDPPRVPTPFPVDALPDWAAQYVTALAEATQTPPDLAGCCVLGVLAASAGGRAVVEARRGWREPLNLYLLPVLRPGSRKSAVVSAATNPLCEVEETLAARVAATITETTALRDIEQKRAEKARRDAVNAKGGNRDNLLSDAVSAAAAAEGIEVPVIPRLIADDVTPEAAASLLADHGGRMAIISAEGGIFDIIAGRYSNNVPALDVWLKGHAGDPLRVDRKGRPPEYVKRPALTMLCTVQPAVLADICRNGAFRGRGLLARVLYSIPRDNLGHRKIGPDPVPEHVTDTYTQHVRKLAEDLADWTDPAVLRLSDDAHELLLDTERLIEPQLAADGNLARIAEWGSKLAGAILRIAGLLHLASESESFRTPISRATLHDAVRIGTYFIEHAQAAFHLLGHTGTSDAAHLLEHLRKTGTEEFTIRDLLTALPRGRFTTAIDVQDAVDVLEDHGYVLPKPSTDRKGPGRKPSPGYIVRPEVAAQSAVSAQCPQ